MDRALRDARPACACPLRRPAHIRRPGHRHRRRLEPLTHLVPPDVGDARDVAGLFVYLASGGGVATASEIGRRIRAAGLTTVLDAARYPRVGCCVAIFLAGRASFRRPLEHDLVRPHPGASLLLGGPHRPAITGCAAARATATASGAAGRRPARRESRAASADSAGTPRSPVSAALSSRQ